MKQEDDVENIPGHDFDLIWTNMYDVNSNVIHMHVTTEEVGENLTVFVEGSLERIHSLQYMGKSKMFALMFDLKRNFWQSFVTFMLVDNQQIYFRDLFILSTF